MNPTPEPALTGYEIARRYHLMRSMLAHRRPSARLCELLRLAAEGATVEDLIEVERAAG